MKTLLQYLTGFFAIFCVVPLLIWFPYHFCSLVFNLHPQTFMQGAFMWFFGALLIFTTLMVLIFLIAFVVLPISSFARSLGERILSLFGIR